MEEATVPSSSNNSHRMSLLQMAKIHLYTPATNELANPVIKPLDIPHGNLEYGERGWSSGPSFLGQCYQPLAPLPRLDEAVTLGTRMVLVSKGLGWENHEVEYVPIPLGYTEWGTRVMKKYCTHLKGSEEGVDYVYGAIYCSLGDYSVSPPLLRSLLEKWDPNTNTFLFSCGERTITLLDLHQIAGLPLDGDPYEEFVPPVHELESSMFLYPKFLSRLLDIWNHLAINNNVGFKDWCDFFHNRKHDCFIIDNQEDERIYTAAFIALWLCSFVVVGGGPYVRPGVLVMASWIVLGRRISLGPPALCSLYYSLRLISTHPIGPSFTHRIWPVHFIAGWMGVYLKSPFGNRIRTPHLPSAKKLIVTPHMVNTMFRTPKHFTPEKAHIFLENRHNISWHPYTLTTRNGVFQHRKVFLISIRRGMLPWRRGCLNQDALIAEPYHPDRVAQQFRFDQVVPFFPLASLYTTSEIGIAYAFWLHLLSLDPEFQYFPSDTRVTDSSVAWASWWQTFVKPFARISSFLSKGSMTGTIAYSVRKNSKYALQRHITARPVSRRDLKVVQRVQAERQAQHIKVIETAEGRIRNRWTPILREYLNDVAAAPPIQPDEQGSLSTEEVVAGTSSSHPLAIDGQPPEIVQSSGGKRSRQSSLAPVSEEVKLPLKRKLDFSGEFAPLGLFENAATDAELAAFMSTDGLQDNVPTDVELADFIEDEGFDFELTGETAFDLSDLLDTCYQLDEFGMSSAFSRVGNVPPTLSAFHFPSTLHGNEQDGHSLGQNLQMDQLFIKDIFLNATDLVVQKVLEGLDISTLGNSDRRNLLEMTSKTLPGHIPEVAKVHGILAALVTLSNKLEANQNEVQQETEQESRVTTEVKLELQSQEGVVTATADELSSVRKLRMEKAALVETLKAQLQEASDDLKKIEEKEEQLHQAHLAQESKLKEQQDKLQNVSVGQSQRLIELQQQATALEYEAHQLVANLQDWRSL